MLGAGFRTPLRRDWGFIMRTLVHGCDAQPRVMRPYITRKTQNAIIDKQWYAQVPCRYDALQMQGAVHVVRARVCACVLTNTNANAASGFALFSGKMGRRRGPYTNVHMGTRDCRSAKRCRQTCVGGGGGGSRIFRYPRLGAKKTVASDV